MITATTKMCMVIGNPIAHSLSPQLHNAGFAELGIAGDFVYTAVQVSAESLADAIKGFRAMRVRGLSVTIPHKTAIIPLLDSISEEAKKIGAVNTVVNENGKFIGMNTDYIGIMNPLKNIGALSGKRVAIFGAGGATRAAVYAVKGRAKDIRIFNRTYSKANDIAKDFGVQASSLADTKLLKDFDVLINCTALGLHKEDPSIIPRECFHEGQVAFDIIFNQRQTKFMEYARVAGAKVIHGKEMFFEQGFEQFKLFTGQPAPMVAMKLVVNKYLGF